MRTVFWIPLLVLALVTPACAPSGQPALVDDVDAAFAALEARRTEVQAATDLAPAERVREMARLGLWEDAEAVLSAGDPDDSDLRVAGAALRFQQHRFQEAEAWVEAVLERHPDHREALLLRGDLFVQAWELERAAELAGRLAEANSRDEDAALLLGRVRLLERRYDEALDQARQVQKWNRGNARGYLLEADARFWDQDPAGAEPALIRALELEPFHPDARFNYGYAIWRRVDATLLDDMAAQWTLALTVHPLHYITHWHWGNGHTNLTYADYVHPTDSVVRERLLPARELIARNRIDEAAEMTRRIEAEFPESVHPAITRGSAYYMAYDMDLQERLDSAQAIFQSVLERKPNYGPAHNGLATVIKQRQFTYLFSYDSLQAVVEATELPDDPAFDQMFSDIADYPGDRVEKMVRSQLGPGIAFLPLLARMGASYTIPPLHIDLAEALGSPGMRTRTTFDNRQWMDIRGAGSGAAGIEYVERGAQWERNVVAHEFAHQFHGRVLSDAENRRLRQLYFEAMEGGYVLDYYAANNEQEYFAQGYAGYLMPVKAHPLNHKSMNTRDYVRETDPQLYAFVEGLAERAAAYQAGDESAFKSNWAELYVRLSEQERRRGGSAAGFRRGGGSAAGLQRGGASAADLRRAEVLLDSALIRDPEYLPAMLSYASLRADAGQLAAASEWLDRAASLDPGYAPVYAARADLVAAHVRSGELSEAEAFEERAQLLGRAVELEDDLVLRARLHARLWTLHADHGRMADAIRLAEGYAAEAPAISTALRDSRDRALGFAAHARAVMGDTEAAIPELARLVGQRPQDFNLRAEYADALAAAGLVEQAVATLEEVQRILRAAGSPRMDFVIRTAALNVARGDTAASRESLEPVLDGGAGVAAGDPRLIRVLASLGDWERVDDGLARLDAGSHPAARAEAAFTHGWVAEARADLEGAESAYRRALEESPDRADVKLRLSAVLEALGRGG